MSAFFIYGSNAGNLYTYDSAPASLFAFNALEHRTLAFDVFRNGYLPAYVFTEAPNGHLEPIFPIGTAILSAPIYLFDWIASGAAGHPPDITTASFEPQRLKDEKAAAILIASAAAMLFFLCARRMAPLPESLVATIAFAFGTDMWTVGSQALWQHGSVAIVLLTMLLALLRAAPGRFTRAGAAIAGLCAGFLPVVRPTAALFSLAAFAFVYLHVKNRRSIFTAAAVAGYLPALLWNAFVFHSLTGGYAVNETSYTFSPAQGFEGLLGLLVSPNRGLFVYTPFVIFSIAGAIVAADAKTPQARLMQSCCIASVATFVNYVFFQRWEGGSTFGPRYLTDIMPIAGLMLLSSFSSRLKTGGVFRNVAAATAIATIVISVCVQTAGANGEPKTNWSGIPDDSSLDTARIWRWRDSQIERDARATALLWGHNPTFPQAYATGFDGRIVHLTPLAGSAGAAVPLDATLLNVGASRWYGYDTGIYYGRVQIRVRFFDATGALAFESAAQIAGDPTTGESAAAIGTLALPPRPGNYRTVVDIDAYQDARIGSRHIGATSSTAEVGAPSGG